MPCQLQGNHDLRLNLKTRPVNYNMYLIYKITNTVNNKIYIGQTHKSLKQRLYQHIWASKYRKDYSIKLHNAIRKYGEQEFAISLIASCKTKAEANDLERMYIELFKSTDPAIGYNLARGGEGGIGGAHFAGHKHSKETKQKMSIDRTGELNANYGNRWHHTSDMKYKYDGENNPMYGKHHSTATKDKIRKAHVGKKAYSNIKLNIVMMLDPKVGERLIEQDINWTRGNIHKIKQD